MGGLLSTNWVGVKYAVCKSLCKLLQRLDYVNAGKIVPIHK